MKKVLMVLVFIQVAQVHYGQIIADHTIVDRYDEIPQQYIDEVKKMWLVYAGESHSYAIRYGLKSLGASDETYAVNVVESGIPEAYTTSHLRTSCATWGNYSSSTGWIYSYGEEDWWTNSTAISRTKAGITYCNSNNLKVSALGFGWCWDAYYGASSSGTDPVYGVRWYGVSNEGIDGSGPWGLDSGDSSVTGNRINLDTYLHATQEYIDYCADSIATKVFFTTGPVDGNTGEGMYQAHLKYERIRDYVAKEETRILFDYADILCYDDDGTQTTSTWNGHSFPVITATNLGDGSIGHIGKAGSVRLAKALWWMLARIAGWDGGQAVVPVSAINLSPNEGSSEVITGGTLQFTAEVLPSNATNKALTWSVTNQTGTATITQGGLLTALEEGMVMVIATAQDGSGVSDSMQIAITDPEVLVTAIIVTSEGEVSALVNGDTLQFTAEVLPSNATNKAITWSVTNQTGTATITQGGWLTALEEGMVMVVATAQDGSGVSDSMQIAITHPEVLVTEINVTAPESVNHLIKGDTVRFTAHVLPENANNKEISWSVENESGESSINQEGVLTALASGTVSVIASAQDGSGVTGSMQILIADPVVMVSAVSIKSENGEHEVTVGKHLQLSVEIIPENATNKGVMWKVNEVSGKASITQEGLLVALKEGIVEVLAVARDGSGKRDTMAITVTANNLETSEVEKEGFELTLYPIPSKGVIYLDAGSTHVNLIQVIDIGGRVIEVILPGSREQIIEIDLSNEPSGTFYLKIHSGEGTVVKQVIILQ